jgi:hypothetical protein
MKAERMYKQVLPYRRKQEKYWDDNSSDIISNDISEKLSPNIKYIRFSEAGDFKTQNDVDKMISVATSLARYHITVYGYTARKDLNFDKAPSNMIINGSGFMVHNNFEAVKEYSGKNIQCKGNCRLCNICKHKGKVTIEVKYH